MNSSTEKPKRGNLVDTLVRALRESIDKGDYAPGDRLPTEAKLTEEYGVSRTVVREAMASLKSDGLVEPRQGAGVFVLDHTAANPLPFRDVDAGRVSSVIEILEVRAAVEVEAAGLAAERRSPAQEERIIECYRRVVDLGKTSEGTSQADFDLHLAIADATNNTRFGEFLRMIGPSAIPRRALGAANGTTTGTSYRVVIDDEHKTIVNAILAGDKGAARKAMRQHLEDSQARYRSLLRDTLLDSA